MSDDGNVTDPTAELAAMGTCAAALSKLDDASRSRAISWLVDHFGFAVEATGDRGSGVGERQQTNDDTDIASMSPKDFVVSKLPKTEAERFAVLAYYRVKARGESTFKTADLTALNTEAAQPKVSNPSDVASNATKSSHFFTAAGAGSKQLTPVGEQYVEALPDREAAKEVVKRLGRPKRRAAKKAASNKKGEE